MKHPIHQAAWQFDCQGCPGNKIRSTHLHKQIKSVDRSDFSRDCCLTTAALPLCFCSISPLITTDRSCAFLRWDLFKCASLSYSTANEGFNGHRNLIAVTSQTNHLKCTKARRQTFLFFLPSQWNCADYPPLVKRISFMKQSSQTEWLPLAISELLSSDFV